MPIIKDFLVDENTDGFNGVTRMRLVGCDMARGLIPTDCYELLLELEALHNYVEWVEADPVCHTGWLDGRPIVSIVIGERAYICEAKEHGVRFSEMALFYWCCAHLENYEVLPGLLGWANKLKVYYSDGIKDCEVTCESLVEAALIYAFGEWGANFYRPRQSLEESGGLQ